MTQARDHQRKAHEVKAPTLEDLAAMNAAAAMASLSQVDAAILLLGGTAFWGGDDWRDGPLRLDQAPWA